MTLSPKRKSAAAARAQRIAAVGYDYAGQPKIFISACNLCGADQWMLLTYRDRYGHAATLAVCEVCGLTTLNPRMTAAAYADFYVRAYRPLVSAYYGRLINARTIQAEQGAYAADLARFVAPFLVGRAKLSLLDIGGSTGIVAAHFVRVFGVRATVLDPAPDEIAEARALGIETITGLVETWDPGGRRFDLIGMFQTIDHLLDVASTLRKVRAIIAPGGLFLVDIVDVRAVCRKKASVEEAVKIDHPYYFTEETAEAYLAQAGFRVLRKAVSPDGHLVGYVCAPAVTRPDARPPPGHALAWIRELRGIQPRPHGAAGAGA
ncbi:MAG: class I SAM-dependent methyltransferase [Kiritimatiellaeota bacterium]|nr:class I SAM-dependent methyltransferase [Kiritimatiellota bacterium]